MTKTLSLLVLTMAIVFACTTAQAAMFNFRADLAGSNVVPPNASNGTGFGTFVYDSVLSQLSYHIEYSSLTGTATAALIHDAAAGVNGPFVFHLALGSPSDGTWTNAGTEPLTPALVAELFASNLYVNIHTSFWPGGEIRGQILPVPEPSSLAGLLLGAGALFIRRRR